MMLLTVYSDTDQTIEPASDSSDDLREFRVTVVVLRLTRRFRSLAMTPACPDLFHCCTFFDPSCTLQDQFSDLVYQLPKSDALLKATFP